MSRHLHRQLPSLTSLQVVVQSPADYTPAIAGILKKLSETITQWTSSPEMAPGSVQIRDDFTDPVCDTHPPVPMQETVRSAPADSVRNVENEDQANVCLITYMSGFQV